MPESFPFTKVFNKFLPPKEKELPAIKIDKDFFPQIKPERKAYLKNELEKLGNNIVLNSEGVVNLGGLKLQSEMEVKYAISKLHTQARKGKNFADLDTAIPLFVSRTVEETGTKHYFVAMNLSSDKIKQRVIDLLNPDHRIF